MDVPIGTIVIWGGGAIPSGWALCNGSNGTPNLVGRFVKGANSNADLKAVGGSTNHVHGNAAPSSGGGHGHTGISGTSGNSGTEMYYGGSGENAAGNHSHSLSGSVNAVANHAHTIGNTNSADHMPLHKYLQFIMRIS